MKGKKQTSVLLNDSLENICLKFLTLILVYEDFMIFKKDVIVSALNLAITSKSITYLYFKIDEF